MTFCRLSKLAGNYNRDLTPYEIGNCKKDTLVFDGDICVSHSLDFLLNFKGEERKVKSRNVEYNLKLHSHNGSGFDTWIKLNNLLFEKHIVDIKKNGKGIISMRVFNGYIHNGKKTNSSISNFQMWYDSFKLLCKEIGKDFLLTKRKIKN